MLIDKNNYEPPIQTAELFLFVESFFHQSIEFFISNIIVSVKNIRLAVIKGLAKLAEKPETVEYDTLKKILGIVDKPIETQAKANGLK